MQATTGELWLQTCTTDAFPAAINTYQVVGIFRVQIFTNIQFSGGFKLSRFWFSHFAQQYSSVIDHAPYSYWYDTPLAQDRVPRVCAKKMMAHQASFSVEAMVRGYHAYKDIWTAVNGEELHCQREDGNRVDTFALWPRD